jgi:hypothetical protein
MKCNEWTLALIGAGLVSLPAVTLAEEKPASVLTALSPTTLSGYVDTSMHWNLGTGNANLPSYTANGQPGGTKADGFNLNVVDLTLNKPVDGEGWGAGYNATLLFGPDAVGYNNSPLGAASDFSLKDTYVALHAPIGNGLDIKLGTYTEILGYEVFEAGSNPNYTRSYGYMIEPTQMTGVLATYQLCSALSVSAGICNAWSAGVNARSFPAKSESYKTYMASATFTAPTNWGVLGGSTVSGGAINGYDAINGVIKTSWYGGGTFNTPISTLKVGVAFDYVNLANNVLGPIDATTGLATAEHDGYQGVGGVYVNWQATEKLSFNTRGEYEWQSDYLAGTAVGAFMPKNGVEITETIQYDLWKNVIARAEFRWDHATDATGPFGKGVDNAYLLAANIIYKF